VKDTTQDDRTTTATFAAMSHMLI